MITVNLSPQVDNVSILSGRFHVFRRTVHSAYRIPFSTVLRYKFLVTTGCRSVARILQRVRVGWGGVRPSHTLDTYLTVISTFTLSFTESEFCRMTTE